MATHKMRTMTARVGPSNPEGIGTEWALQRQEVIQKLKSLDLEIFYSSPIWQVVNMIPAAREGNVPLARLTRNHSSHKYEAVTETVAHVVNK